MSVHRFETTEDLAVAASDLIAASLSSALTERGRASLMLSGGSSPKPIYERLSQSPLAWKGVGISLVDERWVAPGEAGSNADFLRGCMAGSPMADALFVPLYNGHPTAADGTAAAEQALGLMAQPFDVCVLGMGSDGHTASWFPGTKDLASAVDPENAATVCAVDVTGAPVAGEHTDRITLTYSAIAKARQVILLLPSAEKAAIFDDLPNRDWKDAPAKLLLGLPQLSVFTIQADPSGANS